MNIRIARALVIVLTCGICSAATPPTTVPHTFRAGQPARASEINENFSALVDAVNALQMRVDALEEHAGNLESRANKLEGAPLTPEDIDGLYVWSGLQTGIASSHVESLAFGGILLLDYEPPGVGSNTATPAKFSYTLRLRGKTVGLTTSAKQGPLVVGTVTAMVSGDWFLSADNSVVLQLPNGDRFKLMAISGNQIFVGTTTGADGSIDRQLAVLTRTPQTNSDTDGDGVMTSKDLCPDTPAGYKVDAMGCPEDFDNDGVPGDFGNGPSDVRDSCPNTPLGVVVDSNGCPVDTDDDGVPDTVDDCPDTPEGVLVESTGCPVDSDRDGVPDYLDQCPETPSGAHGNANGCPQ